MTSSSSLTNRDSERLDQMVEAAREIHAERLVVSTSGNISARLDGGDFAISRARARLGGLRRRDLLVVRLEDDSFFAPEEGVPGGRPSRETPMHRALYRADPELEAVLHFQSPAATMLACSEEPCPDLGFIPEFPVYIRRIARVPFLPPGSEELARAVVDAFRDAEVRLIQLENHGQVVRAEDPAQAVERAAFFELACRLYLLAEGRFALRRFPPSSLEMLLSY